MTRKRKKRMTRHLKRSCDGGRERASMGPEWAWEPGKEWEWACSGGGSGDGGRDGGGGAGDGGNCDHC